jgi:hypothetical protein
MKLTPPILLLTTATAFAPPRQQQPLHHHVLHEQSPVKDDVSAADDYATPIVPEMNVEASFNIGEMPTVLDEQAKKKMIAKVSASIHVHVDVLYLQIQCMT